jgi:XTP/dITP diphosphohydrolase
MKKIIAGTRNRGKIKEIKEALAELPFEIIGLPDDGIADAEETGSTFEQNAVIKASCYFRQTGEYCLADDSGLEVDALEGKPGVFSARYAGETSSDTDNNEKLLRELQAVPKEKRTARFRSVLALTGPDGSQLLAEGTCEGILLNEPRGEGGFGYDPLFFMPEQQKTLAEMTVAEKNAVSHRGNALKVLKQKLMASDYGRQEQ